MRKRYLAGKTVFLTLACCLVAAVWWISEASALVAPEVDWAGRGHYRLLVRVDPREIGNRPADEMPAEVDIDFETEIARRFGILNRRVDIESVQVIRYSPQTGKPLHYGAYAYATTPYDRPFRWYDHAIPENYPENEANIDATAGALRWSDRPMWGYFYNVIGDWRGGKLAWAHTQENDQASYYAIYFDLLPVGSLPRQMPPSGFLGDGMNRTDLVSRSTTALIHSRVALDDWNGDGLIDLIVGCARGAVLLYPNTGSRVQPQFPYSNLLLMADGKPLDIGWSSVPVIVDWDGDGVKDLIIGAEWNRFVFLKNEGSNAVRRLVNKGFVMMNGRPLELPAEPNPEGRGIYKRDYYPVPEIVDWDGDGDLDLLAGGYVTGMIYFFENVGKGSDGLPLLAARGPLHSDGAPVDVGWAAAPCVADFDGDGDLDLVSGSMPMTPGGGDSTSAEDFLWYFENVGTRKEPRLQRRSFPRQGAFPNSSLGTPRAADVNGDGLLDLVVSAHTNIYIYLNIGKPHAPLFAVHDKPLPSRWGSESLPSWGAQYLDWNGDGKFDILSGFTVHLNSGKGSPGIFDASESILLPSEKIAHPAPMGDDWMFVQLSDLDGDGKRDVLFGDHGGHIWFHRNLGHPSGKKFDKEGLKITTLDGRPIKVGPREGQAMDFDVLQGARTTFAAADFDGDKKVDLVVGDTYGVIRFYRNVSSGGTPVMAEPQIIGDMKSRMVPVAADWNRDGLLDVIGSAASGNVQVYYGMKRDGKWGFTQGEPLRLPPFPYGPTVSVVDWNGDGDDDLIINTAYGYTCFLERSFLEHGAGRATRLALESVDGK